ncbi:MAG: PaaI family thioesterase [Burkholderiales bacterium]|nr:PaaI family thioesterase [Burkholderiales bacterium]
MSAVSTMSTPAAVERTLDFEPHPADAGARLVLQPRRDLLNHQGNCHGAAVMALLEAAMQRAASTRGASWHDALTVDLHVSFLRPGQGLLSAEAQVTGGGKRLCFCEARVRDADGALVAQALATLRAP